jgi:hypothetical protein
LLIRYPEDKIVVYGRSLGTTFATYVASQNHPKQLILEAPFYSLDKVANHRFPIYPVNWFLKFHFPTYEYLKEVSCPITIFHGTDDVVVNYENSEKLSKIRTKGKLKFITISEGTHHNLDNYEVYKKTLDTIL